MLPWDHVTTPWQLPKSLPWREKKKALGYIFSSFTVKLPRPKKKKTYLQRRDKQNRVLNFYLYTSLAAGQGPPPKVSGAAAPCIAAPQLRGSKIADKLEQR